MIQLEKKKCMLPPSSVHSSAKQSSEGFDDHKFINHSTVGLPLIVSYKKMSLRRIYLLDS